MHYFFIFITELLVLFFLSKQVTRSLSLLFLYLTRNHKAVVYIMALIFFPGTVVHELSHFLAAVILFVPTGDIDLLPKIHGEEVKLGSVQIAKTDPIRRSVIGVAPFLFGITIILATLFFFLKPQQFSLWQIALVIYLLFEVSNTMFSSKKDMEGVLSVLVALGVVLLLFYLLGFRLQIPQFVFSVFQTASRLLLVPLGVDIGVILLAKLLHRHLFH